MNSYSSREVIQIITVDGCYKMNCVGDRHQFKHPNKSGKVTITHPVKDIPIRTLKSIEKQVGLKFK